MDKTIYITLADGGKREWSPDEYDSYEVNHGLFVVEKDYRWVGIYPLIQIRSVDVY